MPHGLYFVLITAGAIGLLLGLILVARLHAFLALLIVSMALGLAAGMPPAKVLASVQTGVGDALSFIAVVVGLGAIIGQFLQDSGGGRVLAEGLLKKSGPNRAPWAVLTAAFLVGLPVFFEVGFIILAPLAWSFARESKRSLLLFGLPIAAALTITHALVPPHPAPAVAAQLLGADVGHTILYGAALSVPLMIIGGIFYGKWIARSISPTIPEAAARHASTENYSHPPSLFLTVLLLVLPVVLILLATVGHGVFKFLGHPFTALLITALAALYFLGWLRGLDGTRLTKVTSDALTPLATLLLVIGGGGALKQIIVDSGIGPYLGGLLAASPLSPLLVCFLTAAGLRAAQGSATVAIVTAAGILAPLMKQLHGYTPEMLVLAVCCGGTTISHVNDAGFWLVKEYLGMTVAETLRSWTVMKIIMGVFGIVLLLICQALFFHR